MNRKHFMITSIFLLGSLLVSLFVLSTPLPNMENDDEFNTKLVIEHIAEISKEPHSVFDPIEHENVRLYIKDQLESFVGVENVYEHHYDRTLFLDDDGLVIEYDIDNILAVIPGSSDTAIMVVAHYDSRGHIGRYGELGNSYGAADDGYGVGVMLEIARLYGEKDLENTIYLLFTDGEETGLFGAEAASTELFMDDVGFIINIEARGIEGPAYMFETSTNNKKIIDFYKNADFEVSYSLATAVYTVMPNYTDFTEFLDVGKQGINFAVLDGLMNYHTPLDNLSYINPSSIDHYGTQIIPLIEEFTMNDEYSDIDYFVSDEDQVFFTLLPNVFISYTETFGNVLHIVLITLFVSLVAYILYKKQTTIKHLGISFGMLLGVLISTLIIGNIVGRVIAFIGRVPFNITYVRVSFGGLPTLITLLFIVLASAYLYKRYINTDERQFAVIAAGTFINLLFAVLVGFALSGAGFLFLIPGFSGLLVLAFKTKCKFAIVKVNVIGVLFFLNLLILVPLLYSLFLAITVGGLLAFCAILVFYLYSLVPAFYEAIK